MFERLLIANRGEIACRVIATCRRLAIETVAVYSDADRDARHVRLADRAVRIGPAEAAASYLDGDAILAAARATGAQAVHPGYGFLSENAPFAAAVEAAGLAFVGPTPDTIRRMGSKAEAKATVAAAGVPTVPGYAGERQDDATLATAAERLGFPLMIKAVAGGGGKGLRIVHEVGALTDALGAARREAQGAFGDATVLLERFVERPRHIEVQVFGDGHGQVVHLFERDCSSQRRYQKIIEEAPAPGLDDARRRALGEAAVAAARAVAYRNAGTVEFIVAPDDTFFFLEMNTRLQVEHPVTEAITGLDLVEWQLRIAAGEPLPLAQERIERRGHAMEARLYAEDPERGFLPSTGRIAWLAFPEGVRVDTGVETGDTVTVHYDPMVAKLIVHGTDREATRAALRAALARTVLRGPRCNRDFLLALTASEPFVAGRMDTAWLDAHPLPPPAAPPADAVLAATLLMLQAEEQAALARQRTTADPHAPWARRDGWRPGHEGRRVVSLRWRDRHFVTDAWGCEGRYRLRPQDDPGAETTIEAVWQEGDALRWRTGRGTGQAFAEARGRLAHVALAGEAWELDGEDPFAFDDAEAPTEGRILAPMPGRVVSLSVEAGTAVAAGEVVGVLEAMKMELSLTAPRDGTVEAVRAAVGDFVEADALLIVLHSQDHPGSGPASGSDRNQENHEP